MAFKSLTPSPFHREGREKKQRVWSRADRPVVGRGCARGWLVGEARVPGQRERENVCVCCFGAGGDSRRGAGVEDQEILLTFLHCPQRPQCNILHRSGTGAAGSPEMPPIKTLFLVSPAS